MVAVVAHLEVAVVEQVVLEKQNLQLLPTQQVLYVVMQHQEIELQLQQQLFQ